MKSALQLFLVSVICFLTTVPVWAEDKPFAGTELTILMIAGHDVGLKTRLPEFEQKTGIKVNIITVSMPDLYAKLGTEFATGGNSYDVTEMMWAAAQGYARGGNLYELDQFMTKYHVDTKSYSSVYVDNHMIQFPQKEGSPVICLPHQADLQILAYRADLFENDQYKAEFKKSYGYELAPPASYPEFIDMAKFFTRDLNGDGENDLFGTVVMGKNFPSLVGDITSYIRGMGGNWLDKNNHPVIDSKESIAGIQLYYDLFDKEKVTPKGAATYSWGEEVADFQNGRIAMMQIWPGAVVALEDKQASKVAGKIKYSIVPGKAPTVGGWAVAIPKTAKKPEASFIFMNWLTSEKIALSRAQETGFSTATQALYDDPVMLEKFSYLPAVKASLPYGKGWPQIGEFTSIWQIGAQEISRIFSGELSVEESAKNMQKQLDRLMTDGGYY